MSNFSVFNKIIIIFLKIDNKSSEFIYSYCVSIIKCFGKNRLVYNLILNTIKKYKQKTSPKKQV